MTGYQLIWLFLCYSFLGWMLETVVATLRQRHITNRGLINGPFCIIYGISALLISFTVQELTGFMLFLFAAVYATAVEWIAGHLIEKIYHERWWNYSDVKWNLGGYVCLPTSVLWGLLGFVAVKVGNQLLVDLFDIIPSFAMHLIIWILIGLLMADILFSLIPIFYKGEGVELVKEADGKFSEISKRLQHWIHTKMTKRIQKAYPKSEKVDNPEKKTDVFAYGCGFYKVVLLFFIGSFLGDVVETIFCRLKAGVWMSRSSVVWGPFSIVWGLAIAVITAMLVRYKDRSDGFLFTLGVFLGGAYEYLCSVFTEIVFGKVFWDYSDMPFNLGGRINLLYCLFWGIASVVWFKIIYVRISDLIEKIPIKVGKIVTWGLIAFMVVNVEVTCMALVRHDERSHGVQAESSWQIWMDEHYDDARMAKIYPDAQQAN